MLHRALSAALNRQLQLGFEDHILHNIAPRFKSAAQPRPPPSFAHQLPTKPTLVALLAALRPSQSFCAKTTGAKSQSDFPFLFMFYFSLFLPESSNSYCCTPCPQLGCSIYISRLSRGLKESSARHNHDGTSRLRSRLDQPSTISDETRPRPTTADGRKKLGRKERK